MTDKHPSSVETKQHESGARRAWQAPLIEELDFTQTEAAYIPGAPNDLGIYTI